MGVFCDIRTFIELFVFFRELCSWVVDLVIGAGWAIGVLALCFLLVGAVLWGA